MFESQRVVGDGRRNQVELGHFHSWRDNDLARRVPLVHHFRLRVGNLKTLQATNETR